MDNPPTIDDEKIIIPSLVRNKSLTTNKRNNTGISEPTRVPR